MTSNNRFDRTRNAPKGVTGLFGNKKRLTALLALFASLALWWLIWWIAAKTVGVSFILPSPTEAFAAFFALLPQKLFWEAVLGSLARIAVGYALGVAFGALIAFAGHFIEPIGVFFSPLIKIARATPVASFILICALWMSSDITPIFISFLMVFPIVYENTLTGLKHTSTELIELTAAYRFSPIKRLKLLYIPSAAPYVGSACMTSVGLAWKSCVSAEVLIVTAKSVGYYVYTSKLYFETEQLFAWTVAIVILSVLLEYSVKLIARLFKYLTERRYSYAE